MYSPLNISVEELQHADLQREVLLLTIENIYIYISM